MAQSFRIAPPPDAEPPDWWPRFFAVRQWRLRAILLRHLGRNGELSRLQISQLVTAYDRLELEIALGDLESAGLVRREDRDGPTCHGSRVGMRATYYSLVGEGGEAG